MPSLAHSVTVAAPAAEVFAYFTEPAKATLWQSSLLEARLSPAGPMRAGTRIAETRRLLGRRVESTVEVTELEAPRRFAGRAVSGPMRLAFAYTLTEAHGSTRVEASFDGEPGGALRLAGPLLVRALRSELEEDLARLKRAVEDAANPSPEA